MNHLKLKAAVKKYSEQFKSDPEAVKEAIALDYDADEVPAILAALTTPIDQAQPPAPAAEHSHYKWFDEFNVRIQKKEVLNVLLRKNESVITGWQIETKKHPKLIEPHIATQLNSFADGYDVLGVGALLLPRDVYKTGDIVDYKVWAKEQGKNFDQDINILLNKPAA